MRGGLRERFKADASLSLLLAGVLISLSLRLSLASFRGKYSVHKYENKPIIDPWTEFVSIRFCC